MVCDLGLVFMILYLFPNIQSDEGLEALILREAFHPSLDPFYAKPLRD